MLPAPAMPMTTPCSSGGYQRLGLRQRDREGGAAQSEQRAENGDLGRTAEAEQPDHGASGGDHTPGRCAPVSLEPMVSARMPRGMRRMAPESTGMATSVSFCSIGMFIALAI